MKATVQECRDAFKAFSGPGGIGSVVLPAKAAWRVSRLISKLKPVVRDFEETQRKLIIDAGGRESGGMIELKNDPKGKTESDADFKAREAAFLQQINDHTKAVEELTKEEVEVDYESIPLSLFENEREPDKSPALKPMDLANAGPFIQE